MCLWGAPSPIYKGVEEGEGRPSHGAPKGGDLLPVGVGFPLSLVGVGEKEGGETRKEGRALHLVLPLLSSTKAQ